MHQNANVFRIFRAAPNARQITKMLEACNHQCVICECKFGTLVEHKGEYVQTLLQFTRFDDRLLFPTCHVCIDELGNTKLETIEEARNFLWNLRKPTVSETVLDAELPLWLEDVGNDFAQLGAGQNPGILTTQECGEKVLQKKRRCRYCKELFEPAQELHVFCSPRCKLEEWLDRNPKVPKCTHCGKDIIKDTLEGF